ncbi:MAG: tetratricopeptide repeat protein [Planctomycetes bacterium]|nr:tetratricopeptide repeat protein [Planctomycetota bacterium]
MRRTIPFLLCLAACSSAPVARREVALDQAHVEFLSGNYAHAAQLYERALPSLPDVRRAEALCWVGKCRLGAGDPEGAIAAFTEALSAGPSPELRVEVHYRRAAAYNARWQPVEALSDLIRVREAGESLRGAAVRSEEYLYRLAVTMIRAGDWKGGRTVLGEVMARFPDTREALDAKDRAGFDEFRVQIGRMRDPKGMPGEAVPSAAGDYLVLVGRFPRFADAVREMEGLRRTGFPDAFVVP